MFRKEAQLSAKRLEGKVITRLSRELRLGCMLFFSLVLLFIIFTVSASFSKKLSVRGQLLNKGSTIKLTAAKKGVINQVLVQPGEMVSQGTKLIEVVSQDYLVKGQTHSSLVRERIKQKIDWLSKDDKLQRQKSQLELSSLNNQEHIQTKNIQRIIKLQSLYIEKQDIHEKKLKASKQLADAGTLSLQNLENIFLSDIQAKQEYLQWQHDLISSQQEVQQLKIKRQQLTQVLEAQLHQNRLKRLQLEAEIQQLEEETSYWLYAQAAGKVAKINIRKGQSVNAGQSVVEMINDTDEVYVELYLPNRAMSRVNVGTEINLKLDAYPYQQYGQLKAQLSNIDLTTNAASSISTHNESGQTFFIASAEILGAKFQSLTSGLTLTADLILERNSIIDWLLMPLRKFESI
jgi:membrane fusion protein